MSAGNLHRKHTETSRRRSLSRLFLLLLLWQGPFPVCHSHASFQNSGELQHHLQCFHSDESSETLASCEHVHVHLMAPSLPGDADSEGSDQSRAPREIPYGCGQDRGLTDVTAEWSSGLEVWSALAGLPVMAGEPVGRELRTGSFLEGYAPQLALPVRLGVMRI